MYRGYVKIWRKTIDTGILKKHKLCAFWLWCLLKAAYRESIFTVGYQEIELQMGQFIFGRQSAMYELGLTEQEIKTCLKALKATNNITIKATNKFSVITIINWGTYQQEQPLLNQPDNHNITTNKKIKNIKEEKNIKENTKEKSATEKLEDFLKTKAASLSLSLYEEKILEFFYYRKKIKAPYKTEKGINGLLSDIQGCLSAGLDVNQCLDLAMEKEWKAVNPKYFGQKATVNRTQREINNINACVGFINDGQR